MGYEIYSEHPESRTRKAADFSAWSIWAEENAPWSGVSVSDVAQLLQAVCGAEMLPEACTVLDTGGYIAPDDVKGILSLPSASMPVKVREIFQHAVRNGYGVRVVFSKGFGSIAASAYLAKHSST